jgi:predicted transcriptional regulator of viral defense system
MPTRRFIELTETAADQFGLVTLQDARDVGYGPNTVAKLAERGQLERLSRGVYRVPFLAGGELAAYMAAALWPQGARACSHTRRRSTYGT